MTQHPPGGRGDEIGTGSGSLANATANIRVTARDGHAFDTLGLIERGDYLLYGAGGLVDVGGQLRAILKGEREDSDWPELAMFALVRDVPNRHGSALLPFEALDQLFERARSRG